MSDNLRRQIEAEIILKQVFEPITSKIDYSLKELYEQRISQLGIKSTNSLELIGIQYRTLNGILEGKLKMVDFTNLNKLATFLQQPLEKVVLMYLHDLKMNFPEEFNDEKEQNSYLKLYFDLAVLKKAGFIDSISNVKEIREKLTSFFGYKSISDFTLPRMDVAFSAGLIQPKNKQTRGLWIRVAEETFRHLNNTNPYSRERLIEYFPKIRRMTTNVDYGLLNVISDLYKLGITVIYQDYLPSLHLRGATFVVGNKPCVILTNYRNNYATIWFALVHELFHVLFDLDEISANKFHLSEENSEYAGVLEKEAEANDFAREYLLPKEYASEFKSILNNRELVDFKSKEIGIHPNIVYTFAAFDAKSNISRYWSMAKSSNPDFKTMLKKLENPWNATKPIIEHVKYLKQFIYPT